MLQLLNANIVTPYQIRKTNILIDGKKIVRVDDLVNEKAEHLDLNGKYIVPGFIDIHLHGGGGADLMDGDVDSILKIADNHVKYGTTAFYPTTLTAKDEELYRLFDNLKIAKQKNENGSKIMGVHLEGPYLSVNQKGAQDERFLKKAKVDHYKKIINSSDDIARITAAPEIDGALELGAFLKTKGIIASIGHTDAEYKDMLNALEYGYDLLTHFYSGMSMLKRVNGKRVLGAVESGYLFDEFNVEIIADGYHLPPELLKLIYKIKGSDHIALVTDAMRGSGMPEGKSILGSLENGIEVIIEGGVAKMPDRQAFAGSVATMDRLVRNMINLADVPLIESVKMATLTPAKIMGIDDRKGSISPGKDADLVVLSKDLEVEITVVEGDIRYRKRQ
ncbi:N-acetylglucosamine-6-phosphate deacetylase [Halanaerobium sp. ST460_2HS_T2]|uniref:N-acetylglucosamine-6-phosphate deacetylase n=1 Tax=Halanaerobium sp. ST460_2HS_T2 TaxID=2183914 RepID=UPI000E02A167|nr:N-acetylglucosamine-6-phosphate deacetylase [Halanaerobium sp. ST460_2HS_T2]RCW55370.1 N-acetylglucosamine-6-phosphate deacetylase [Halanaerobium sp. ST460_2HS_T2]